MRLRRSTGLKLLAAVLLTIAGLWLSRPNLDPRFVGAWRWSDDSPYPTGFTINDSSDIFVIAADGTAHYEFDNGTAGKPFGWRITATKRLIFEDRLTGLAEIQAGLERLINRVMGRFDVTILDQYIIHEVTADRIVLEYAAMPDSYTLLKRVSLERAH